MNRADDSTMNFLLRYLGQTNHPGADMVRIGQASVCWDEASWPVSRALPS